MSEWFDPKQEAAGFVEALLPMAEEPAPVPVEEQIAEILEKCAGMNPVTRVLLICALVEQIAPSENKVELSVDAVLEIVSMVRDSNSEGVEALASLKTLRAELRQRQARGHHVLAWAVETFGDSTKSIGERALRSFEESAEVLRAAGVSEAQAHVVVSAVFGRPVGELPKEIGALVLTAECLAAAAGIDIEEVAAQEWERIQSIDPERMREHQREKIAAGMAVSL